jgi:hypothetical protein
MHFTFKNHVEFTQEFFFQSDNSHTQANCFFQFFLNVTKRQESVTKNTGQGEIIIQDLDVTTR